MHIHRSIHTNRSHRTEISQRLQKLKRSAYPGYIAVHNGCDASHGDTRLISLFVDFIALGAWKSEPRLRHGTRNTSAPVWKIFEVRRRLAPTRRREEAVVAD